MEEIHPDHFSDLFFDSNAPPPDYSGLFDSGSTSCLSDESECKTPERRQGRPRRVKYRPYTGHGADDRKSKYNTLNETVIASLKSAKASK